MIKTFDATSIDAREIPKPAKILYTRYVRSLLLCLVEFSCAQVSCKIRNLTTRENYRGKHLVVLILSAMRQDHQLNTPKEIPTLL